MKIQMILSVLLLISIIAHTKAQKEVISIDQQHPNHHLYAPWRDTYVENSDRTRQESNKPCPFCTMRDAHEDEKYFVLYRATHHMIILNFQPYTRGHMLIVPYEHHAELADISSDARMEMLELTTTCMQVIRHMFDYAGFNVGFNIGAIAGASVPDHLHMHIVPRKAFEQSFIHTIGHIALIHYDLQKEYRMLRGCLEKIFNPSDEQADHESNAIERTV